MSRCNLRSVFIGSATFGMLLLLPAARAQMQPPQNAAEKACIFNAAAKLPNIPGMVVTAARIGRQTPTQNVELDIRFAGIDVTMGAVCAGASAVLTGVIK